MYFETAGIMRFYSYSISMLSGYWWVIFPLLTSTQDIQPHMGYNALHSPGITHSHLAETFKCSLAVSAEDLKTILISWAEITHHLCKIVQPVEINDNHILESVVISDKRHKKYCTF